MFGMRDGFDSCILNHLYTERGPNHSHPIRARASAAARPRSRQKSLQTPLKQWLIP